MTSEERIIALERELDDTRLAAARLIMRMAGGLATSPQARAGLAQVFEEAAGDPDPITARIARMVAAGLRG